MMGIKGPKIVPKSTSSPSNLLQDSNTAFGDLKDNTGASVDIHRFNASS